MWLLESGTEGGCRRANPESPWAGPILPTPTPGEDLGCPSASMSLRPPCPRRKKAEPVRSPMVPLPMPKKLRFNITPEVKSDIEKAKQNLGM